MKRSRLGSVGLYTLVGALFLAPQGTLAKSTVTIATYSQPRYDIARTTLLPAWTKKNPTIDIRIELYPDFWNKLLTVMATDAAPDIVDTAGSYLFGHVARGGVVDLAPYIRRDLNMNDWFPHLWNEVRYPHVTGTSFYALPYDWVGAVLYYNKDLFDQAGVGYPQESWNWNDLRAAAKKLVADPNGDGMTDVWGYRALADHIVLDAMIRSYGGRVLRDDRRRAAINSPQAREALGFLAALVAEDRSSPPPTVAANFNEGKLAMFLGGTWSDPKRLNVQGLNYGVQMAPAGPVKRDIYGGSNVWEVMRRPRQDMEAVWTMLKELVSRETVSAFSGQHALPARRSIAQDWYPNQLTSTLMKSAEFMRDADWSPDWTQWQAAKTAEINPVLLGERSPVEGLAQAEAAINRVLQQVYP